MTPSELPQEIEDELRRRGLGGLHLMLVDHFGDALDTLEEAAEKRGYGYARGEMAADANNQVDTAVTETREDIARMILRMDIKGFGPKTKEKVAKAIMGDAFHLVSGVEQKR